MALSEFDWIKQKLVPLAQEEGALRLQDDAAVLDCLRDHQLVMTTDTVVEEVHFLKNAAPSEVAAKALGSNLSDLAAMGAQPFGYLMNISRPESLNDEWLDQYAASLKVLQQRYGVSLLGGDTTKTISHLVITLTAFGWVPCHQALKRSGAQEGEMIWVSGTIGDSTLGLEILKGASWPLSEKDKTFLLSRHCFPEPRIALGQALRGIATSAIDISDGLVADLMHICDASNVGAYVYLDRVPLSSAAHSLVQKTSRALYDKLIVGGEDYEILFTAPLNRQEDIRKKAQELNLPLTSIGEVAPRRNQRPCVTLFDHEGKRRPVKTTGYQHF